MRAERDGALAKIKPKLELLEPRQRIPVEVDHPDEDPAEPALSPVGKDPSAAPAKPPALDAVGAAFLAVGDAAAYESPRLADGVGARGHACKRHSFVQTGR